ncbi:hypothetical protein ABK040_009827 [Willaertia magna]
MKIESIFGLDIPSTKLVSKLKAISFHPTNNRIALAFRKEIYEYDISTGSRLASFKTESEVTHIAHSSTHSVLVAALHNGCFSILDLNTNTLTAFHIPIKKEEGRSPSCFSLSNTRPMVFYSRAPSKFFGKDNIVYGMEMFSDSKHRVEYTHKKQITAITTHPSKSMMASASSDGIIKIWETNSHNLVFQIEEYEGNRKERQPVTSLCFYDNGSSSDFDLLVSGTREGNIKVWFIPINSSNNPQQQQQPRVVSYINTEEGINSLLFHPIFPCLLYLNAKGCLNALDVGHLIYSTSGGPKMKSLLSEFEMLEPYYAALHRTRETKKRNIPIVNASIHPKSGLIAFYGKNFQISELNSRVIKGTIVADRFPVFQIYDSTNPQSVLPQSATINCNLEMLLSPKKHVNSDELIPDSGTLDYNIPFTTIPYIDVLSKAPNYSLLAYELKKEKVQVLISSLRATQDLYPYYRLTKSKYSNNRRSLLLFYEKLLNSSNTYESDVSKYFFTKIDDVSSKALPQIQKGVDGGFLNDFGRDYVVLSEGGDVLKVYLNNELQSDIKLKQKLKYISTSPFDKSILYCTTNTNQLGFATSIEDKTQKRLQFDSSKVFHLRDNETLIDIQWQREPCCNEMCLIGVLTSRRVMILSQDLSCLACVESPSLQCFYFQSILWMGTVLLYNTKQAIYCLYPYGQTNLTNTSVGTLDQNDAVLCAALCDRVYFISHKDRVPVITCRYINIVEPLLLGILSIPKEKLNNEQKGDLLKKVTERFDCRSISEKTLICLEQASYPDLATELITNSVFNFSWELRLRLAKSSMNFSYALEVLISQHDVESHHRNGFVDSNSKFYHHFIDLATTALEYGQFSVALKCFDMINDVWGLFNLFATTGNANGLKLLAFRCKDSPDFYSIFTACTLLIGEENLYINNEDFDVKIHDWPLKVSVHREFEVSTEIKGRMLAVDKKDQLTQSNNNLPLLTNAPSIGIPTQNVNEDEISKIDTKDLFKWLGYTSELELSKENWEEIGFKDEFGAGGKVDDDEMSTIEVSKAKSSTSSGLEKINLPPVPVDIKHSTSSPTVSDNQTSHDHHNEKSEVDEDTSDVMSTKEKKNKDDNTDSDSSDEEEDEYDRKTKVFQGLKIKEEVIYKEASANDIRSSMAGLGGLSLGGGATSSRNRRRRGTLKEPIAPINEQSSTESDEKSTSSASLKKEKEEDKLKLVNIDPAQCLKDGMTAIEKGDFKEARNQITNALSALVKDNTQILKKNNIILCVNYKLLIYLLAKIRVIEGQNDTKELARLATFASQTNVINKHKFVCYNMAIKRNLNASNFGITSVVIKQFLPLSESVPKLKEELQKRYEECGQHNFVNNDKELEASFNKSSQENPIKFCWKTFALLGQHHSKCSYCSALFANSDQLESTCPFCTYGNIEEQ